MCVKKSMLNIVFDEMKDGKFFEFEELWNIVANKLNLNEEEKKNKDKISYFYNQLSLDGRFIFVKNKWCLRDFLAYNEIFNHVKDVNDNNIEENNNDDEKNESED